MKDKLNKRSASNIMVGPVGFEHPTKCLEPSLFNAIDARAFAVRFCEINNNDGGSGLTGITAPAIDRVSRTPTHPHTHTQDSEAYSPTEPLE